MKPNTQSRRRWLKNSVGLLAAGTLMPNLKAEKDISSYANQIHPLTGRWMMDEVLKDPMIKVRLTSNENPYGPSDRAKMAVIEGFKDANLYSRHVASDF